jgi:hypothetical protein
VHLDYNADLYNDFRYYRFRAGGNFPVISKWDVMAGGSVDQDRNFSWATGVAWKPKAAIAITLAYQHDLVPELFVGFGHSSTVSLAAKVVF